MKRMIGLVLFILVTLVFNGYSINDEKWELVKTDGKVAVYVRDCADSKYNEVKAVAVMDAPIEVLSGILGDVDAQTHWLTYCKEARIVKDTSEKEKTLYYYLDMPWPVEDRDVVLTAWAEINKETARVIVKGYSVCMESIPPKDTCIRIAEMKSSWLLEADVEDRNKTKIYFIAKANPGGLIPAFVVNYESEREPFKTFEILRKLSKEDKYIKLGEKFREKAYLESLYSNKDMIKKVLENRKSITSEILMRQ